MTGVGAIALALSCGGDGSSGPTNPNPDPNPPVTSGAASLTVVSGGVGTDTIQAKLAAALVVEVRDSTGKLARGRTVHFDALSSDDPKRKTETAIAVSLASANQYSASVADVSDTLGRSRVLIALGTVAGPARVRVSIAELGLVDTVSFTVTAGAASKFVIGTRDTTVPPGATYSLSVSATDRFANPAAIGTPTYTHGPGIASISPAGQVTVGSVISREVIVLSVKSFTDTAHVTILPRLALVGVRTGLKRTVVVVNTDGTGYAELATSTDLSLAPDGAKATSNIVYYQGDPSSSSTVMIVAPNVPARVLVGGGNGLQTASWPRWSQDAAWVYFTGRKQFGGSRFLYRIRPDGTQLDSLGVINTLEVQTPASISPDGATAAVTDNDGVKLITIATKASRIVPATCGDPRYSPDGTKFACLRAGLVSVMNLDGTGRRDLGNAGTFDDLLGVDWSPEGSYLIAWSKATSTPRLINAGDGTTFDLTTLGTTYLQVSFIR